MMSAKKQTVYVVSHFHWDREWYQPFEQYRFRLVRALDDLLDIMENNPDYKYFNFDGQTILMKDYLKIRPQNTERLNNLIKSGRITIGPWYVMPDEFLVSGESLVRNLQMGHDICREYGVEPLNNYYVTDIFGHNSQSPQIAKGFNLDSATLYRGIGDFPKDVFEWKGADGSTINCYKLEPNYCYSAFYFAIRQPFDGREFENAEVLERMKNFLAYTDKLSVSDIFVTFDGCDHADPEPLTPEFIKMFNEEFEDYEFIHTTLNKFGEDLKARNLNLETIEGVLYNSGKAGLNNTLLQNVLSSCVVLKQENAECEMILTRIVEPLDVFTEMLLGDEPVGEREYVANPRTDFLKEAWDLLIQNHPHDSICGCSIGEVHIDNENRFMHVKQICEELKGDELLRLLSRTNTIGAGKNAAFAAFNMGPVDINDVTVFDIRVPSGQDSNIHIYDPSGNEIDFQVIEIKSEMVPNHKKLNLVTFESKNIYTVAAKLSMPAHSYAVYTMGYHITHTGEEVYNGTPIIVNKRLAGTMQLSPLVFDNGLLLIKVNNDGTLDVTVKETGKQFTQLLQLEDGGDSGDGWRYIVPQLDQKVYSGGNSSVKVLSSGALCAQISVTHKMPIPKITDGIRRNDECIETTIESIITITKDNPIISVQTSFLNQAIAHRLRVVIPSDINTDHYFTKLPYDMNRWAVARPDNVSHNDVDTGVSPSQGGTLISDGDQSLALYTRGLYEIEVADDSRRTLFLTLFRSVNSEVGRLKPIYADMKRELNFDYALDFTSQNTPAKVYKNAEQFLAPLFTQTTDCHEGKLEPVQTPVKLEGCENAVITAIQPGFRVENGQFGTAFRVLNLGETDWAGKLILNTAGNMKISEVYLTHLDGRIISTYNVEDNKINVRLTPKQVGTVVIVFS